MTNAAGAESTSPPASCPLCGTVRVRRMFFKQGIPYHRCLECDFVFSRPFANANFETTIDAYEPAYRRYLEASPEDEANFAALLAWAEGFRPLAGRRLLDVGAGSGKFVRFLRGRGLEAYGIEPARALHCQFLADEPWFYAQTLEEFADEWSGGRFDAIYICDVIEHVERPDHLLAGVARLLEPDGMLFVTTPDVSSFAARICGRWWHYFNKYHLSYLSRRTIGRIGVAHALREVGFTRQPRRKSVGYLLQYLADFALAWRGVRMPQWLCALHVDINLHDTMNVAFESTRTGPTQAAEALDR